MTGYNEIISMIEKLGPKARKTLRKNCEKVLSNEPNNTDAQARISALNELKSNPEKTKLISTGLIGWQPYRSGQANFQGFHGGEPVANVFMMENHRNDGNLVYAVEVLGHQVDGAFREIGSARKAGEKSFEALRSKAGPTTT